MDNSREQVRFSTHRSTRDMATWLSARLKHQADFFSPVEHIAIQQAIVMLDRAASEMSLTAQDRNDKTHGTA